MPPENSIRFSWVDSTALGTGLRLRELLGLNVGDISPDGTEPEPEGPTDEDIMF